MPKDLVQLQHGLAHGAGAGSASGGWLSLLRSPWLLLREHWQVVRTSRTMLRQFRIISRSQPRLGRLEAYRLLVQERMHCDRAAAERILIGAAQSFAVWPDDRELQLRDVIHYVAITEFLQQRVSAPGMRSDVQSVVHALVPHYL